MDKEVADQAGIRLDAEGRLWWTAATNGQGQEALQLLSIRVTRLTPRDLEVGVFPPHLDCLLEGAAIGSPTDDGFYIDLVPDGSLIRCERDDVEMVVREGRWVPLAY